MGVNWTNEQVNADKNYTLPYKPCRILVAKAPATSFQVIRPFLLPVAPMELIHDFAALAKRSGVDANRSNVSRRSQEQASACVYL